MRGTAKAQILGTVGRDPEIRQTNSGKKVCNMSLATNFRSPSGEETAWHRIVLFDKLAEVAEKYVRKGSQIFVEGRINYRKWTNQEGIEKESMEVVCFDLQLCGGKNSGSQASPGSEVNGNVNDKVKYTDTDDEDDDIPF